MRLLRPEALWLLALALPLVLLHLRRIRRRAVPVASVRLWKELAAAGGGRRGLRRLREAGALVLLLAALGALVLSLAEPVSGEPVVRPRSLVVILDGSVTMNARDGERSRFEAARDVVLDALGRTVDGDEVTVWLADAEPWVLSGPSRDGDEARAGLARAAPALCSRSLDRALASARMARALRGEDATYLVVTDAPGAASLAEQDVLVATVGGPHVMNASVDAVDRTARGVRVRITAREGDPGERTLEVRVDDAVIAEIPVPLTAGGTIAPEVLIPPGRTGRLEAQLVPPDAFPEDDVSGLVLPPRGPLRVLVLARAGAPAPYLVAALDAMPDLVDGAASLAAGLDAATEVLAAADAVIADGALPADAPDAARRPLVAFVETGQPVRRPLPWGVGDHPVLRGIDLGPLRLERATPLVTSPGDVVLIDSVAGPLAIARERSGVRSVRFGFVPDATTLPLEPAFPLLVRNALRWVHEAGTLPPAVDAGQPLELAAVLPPGADTVVLSLGTDVHRVALGPDTAEPSAPVPRPGGPRVLRIGLPGGAALGASWLRWSLPDGVRLGAPERGPTPAEALAALPPAVVADAPVRRLGPPLAIVAALLLLLGAAFLASGSARSASLRPAAA